MAKKSKTNRIARYERRYVRGANQKASGKGNWESWIEKHETKIVAALLVTSFLILVVFLVPELFGAGSETQTNESAEGISVSVSQSTQLSMNECLAKYGIDPKTTVYIYADTCPASQTNTPWVALLENKGYKVFWANTGNATAMNMVVTCLYSIANLAGTPEFICPANGKIRSGAFTGESEVNNFAAACSR